MIKTQNKKRGFTIVELVIVIAVIAILSAVLIPTFAGIIKKSRRSADETAVYNMNVALVGADEDVDTVEEVIAFLISEGYAVDSYAPLSKDHSFVYSAELNKVLLYSESEKAIVYPKEYAGKAVAFVTLATDDNATPVVAASAADFANGGVVAVKADIDSAATIEVKKDTVVDLSKKVSASTISNDDDSNGVFHVVDGATLTLNGDGEVNGVTASNYNMAVWADGGDVVINGGYYTNEGATDDMGGTQQDLIYVKNGGKITINGGKFKCETPEWTLNSKNDKAGTIIVKGGEFYEFDPSNLPANLGPDAGIILAEGYTVVAEARTDGTWYKVVKAD